MVTSGGYSSLEEYTKKRLEEREKATTGSSPEDRKEPSAK
jgi:hypothetical protein